MPLPGVAGGCYDTDLHEPATDMIVLGIETSCDETAAAVVSDDRRILSNVVLSQLDDHRP